MHASEAPSLPPTGSWKGPSDAFTGAVCFWDTCESETF